MNAELRAQFDILDGVEDATERNDTQMARNAQRTRAPSVAAAFIPLSALYT